jgi:hypothetical protein
VRPAKPGAPPSRIMLHTFCFGFVETTLQARRKQIPALKARNSKARGETPGLDGFGTSPARHARQAKVNRGSAESAAQNSPGWRSTRQRASEPWVAGQARFSPERAAQTDCIALTGLSPNPCHSQGLRPGLCCAALAGLNPHSALEPRVAEPAVACSSTLGSAAPRLRRWALRFAAPRTGLPRKQKVCSIGRPGGKSRRDAGVHSSCLLQKCYLCLRYEVLPMCPE